VSTLVASSGVSEIYIRAVYPSTLIPTTHHQLWYRRLRHREAEEKKQAKAKAKAARSIEKAKAKAALSLEKAFYGEGSSAPRAPMLPMVGEPMALPAFAPRPCLLPMLPLFGPQRMALPAFFVGGEAKDAAAAIGQAGLLASARDADVDVDQDALWKHAEGPPQ
jgi:hypothetical protein